MAAVVLAFVALNIAFRWAKVRHYRGLHRAKRAAGLVIADAKRETWSDGFDWVLTYDDGSVITVKDEWNSPLPWITLCDDADNADRLPPE
jgi:hypothetical protein